MDDDARIGRTVGESEERWPVRPEPAAGSPNVLLVVLDDVGFGQLGCYGSAIDTPAFDRLATEGVRYRNFHVTPLCSPTRAALLTGRNSHSVGVGHIVERAAGFPGYNARLPDSAATVAEVLRQTGYSTWALGKWHLTPSYETGPAGPFDRWPLGRGFERFYGFLGGSTDQYVPELYRDNSPATPPRSPGEEYHLTADLADEAIARVRELRGAAPHKPFFMYFAPGACHTPHQAPREWIDRYRGRFDNGWDAARRETLERQKRLGVVPPGTELGPSNPGVQAWDTLTADERALYARMMEVYAGFLSHTDAQVGRLLDFLAETGELDNTLVIAISDNGASAEGGPEGSLDEGLYFNDLPQRAVDAVEHLDELGGPRFYNHYPWGWAQAGNTPFRWYKQFTHAGGVRAPCIVRYPARTGSPGGVRHQFHHAIDIAPTILELAGVAWPAEVNGVQQMPVHGVSMAYTLDTRETPDTLDTDHAPGRRRSQYFENWGNRGLWRDGWMAVCRLQPDAPGGWPPLGVDADLDTLSWELYDHQRDPAESEDLARKHPDRLRAMVDEWWAAAGRYQVLPVDTRSRSERWSPQPTPPGAEPGRWVFHGPCGPYERGVSPGITGRSFHLAAEVTVPDSGAAGVLYAMGGGHGGYSWYLLGDRMVFEVNLMSVHRSTVTAPVTLPPGDHRLELDVRVDDRLAAEVTFTVDAEPVATGSVDRVLKVAPIGSGRTTVGFDLPPAVSDEYRAPGAFTGRLRRLTVTTGRHRADTRDLMAAEIRSQ